MNTSKNIFFEGSAWIWHKDRRVNDAGYTLFRRRFTCANADELHIAVSADNRYNLYLDGRLIGRGPCKGDLQHYSYEEYRMVLDGGTHVLAAEGVVWNGGWRSSAAPWSEMHSGGGLLVAGYCGAERLDTPGGWRSLIDRGRMPLEWNDAWSSNVTIPAPPMDKIDFNSYDSEWMKSSFDDSAWDDPVLLGRACLHGNTFTDPATPWLLTPSTIKQLISKFTPMASVVDDGGSGVQLCNGRLGGIIPAGTRRILLDIGRNQTSMLHFSGQGAQGCCRIAYAESLTEVSIGGNGYSDELLFSGNAWRYDSFWYRTGRFVELNFNLESDLEISDFSVDFFSYDFKLQADFKAPGNPDLENIWNVSWHTARCCAHEHYEDCPYYEQLQYAGDSRVQALISYAATGDGTLGRQALRHFDWSRLPDGLTQSRYPNVFTQVIPEFSLIWVLMIADYYRYFGDRTVIAEHMKGMRNVLDFFEEHRGSEGLVTKVDGWNFSDWAKDWPAGKSDRDSGEPETILNLFYAEACRSAWYMCNELDLPDTAQSFADRRLKTLDAVNALCFDHSRGLYRDVPSRDWFSCHANALAILADAVPAELLVERGMRLADNVSLNQPTLYFNFYILEALKKCRIADAFMRKLEPWKQMLDLGFTTFPECPSLDTRSECHAWSASPVYEFITGLLGISPALPGFEKVNMAPLLIKGLDLEGKVPVGRGRILSINIHGGQIDISSDAPLDISLSYPNGRYESFTLYPDRTQKHINLF